MIRCSFCLLSVPRKFSKIGERIWRFPSKVRPVVAVGVAAMIWTVWKTRNAAAFDKIFPNDNFSIVCKISYWMTRWLCLQTASVRQPQVIAVNLLFKVAYDDMKHSVLA